MFGTNFDGMEKVFKNRERNALKAKFLAERKRDPKKVEQITFVNKQVPFDPNLFSDESSGNTLTISCLVSPFIYKKNLIRRRGIQQNDSQHFS